MVIFLFPLAGQDLKIESMQVIQPTLAIPQGLITFSLISRVDDTDYFMTVRDFFLLLERLILGNRNAPG